MLAEEYMDSLAAWMALNNVPKSLWNNDSLGDDRAPSKELEP
jgi:hypothetical protein